ncbi:hypothetical protein D3C73_1252870 [compost metagenome]
MDDIRDMGRNLIGKIYANKTVSVFIIVLQTIVAAHPEPLVAVYMQDIDIVAGYRSTIVYIVKVLDKTNAVKFIKSVFCSRPYITMFILAYAVGEVG